MTESNKSPIHLDLESDDSSETEAEIPSISDQPAPTSNPEQPEEPPEDKKTTPKTADTSSDMEESPSLLPPSPTHQLEHSLPTESTTAELLLPTSTRESENKKSPIHLDLESDESSESEAEIPAIPEEPPQMVSTSETEQSELLEDAKTPPKLIDNTSSAIADPLPLLPDQHEQALPIESTTTMESVPPTSRSESPPNVKLSSEELDQPLIDEVQMLGLGEKMTSPENISKSPFKRYIKPKVRKDASWALPFRVRKSGLTTVLFVPDDDDLMPTLGTRQGIRATPIPQQYELSNLRCEQCQRAIQGATSEPLCRQCLEELESVASAPLQTGGAIGGATSDPHLYEGACGGATPDPRHFLKGATAPLHGEEFPRSYGEFKAIYERKTSFEDYVRMRHRQREGIPPYNKPPPFPQPYEEAYSDYGDYERRDSEEEYRRMHPLQREILGVLPPTHPDIFEEMRRAESDIFASMDRPGDTFEDLRDPEREILEIQHYDREMAKLAAKFGGAPLEETTNPWKPQEFLDQETLYKLWRPPPDPVEKDEVEDMSPESRRRYELGRMALMRQPIENVEMLEQKDESEDGSESDESEEEDTEYSEESLPSGSTD